MIYFNKSPFSLKKRLVIETNCVTMLGQNVLGFALKWLIFIKKPVNGMLTRGNGKTKPYAHTLRHEHWHCEKQSEMGLIKWLYKYFTDRSFREYEEWEARQNE